jgi:parvulin-like peptidyl-prolyl isomerase
VLFQPIVLFSQMQSAHRTATMSQPSAAAAGKPAQAQIAEVNSVVLTQSQLEEEMQRLFPYYAIHGGKVPATAEAQLRQQAVHDMVLHELVYQEALRRKVQLTPAVWQKRLASIRAGFPSQQAYEEAAASKYGSAAEFERRLRRVMLVEQLWKLEVTDKLAVTAEAARAYYWGHPSQFLRPEAVWLQSITVSFPVNATAEKKAAARQVAEQILARARAASSYEEFGLLAQQLSQDDWRVMMGDHRWVHRGTVTAEVERAVFALKKGEVSGLVESPTGYLILRANDHQEQRQMPYAEMASTLRKQMTKRKSEERAREFEASLQSKATVRML